jgi:hypothetical protein
VRGSRCSRYHFRHQRSPVPRSIDSARACSVGYGRPVRRKRVLAGRLSAQPLHGGARVAILLATTWWAASLYTLKQPPEAAMKCPPSKKPTGAGQVPGCYQPEAPGTQNARRGRAPRSRLLRHCCDVDGPDNTKMGPTSAPRCPGQLRLRSGCRCERDTPACGGQHRTNHRTLTR